MAAKKLHNREDGNIGRVQQWLQDQSFCTLNIYEFLLTLQFKKLQNQQGNKIYDKDIHRTYKYFLR